jgi:hypothetical protein
VLSPPALADDFVLSGVPFEEMRAGFATPYPSRSPRLRRRSGPLASDPAVAALRARPGPW